MNRPVVLLSLAIVFLAAWQDCPGQIEVPKSTTQPQGIGPATTQPEPEDPLRVAEIRAKAEELFFHMKRKDFARAVEHFDEKMMKDLPPDVLSGKWKDQTTQYGPLLKYSFAQKDKWRAYDIIIINCEFAKADFDAEVLIDKDNKISGLFFTVLYQKPSYDVPERYREQEVEFGDPAWALPGTLTLPAGKGPFPVVVLIHGLGAHDRDESLGPNKPFRDLASGLAARGVGVFRYVKRTRQHPQKVNIVSAMLEKIREIGFAFQEETILDAVEAVFFLRRMEGQVDGDSIFLLGHSMGGALLPRICMEVGGLKGLIVMSGPTRALEDVILSHEQYLVSVDGKVTADEKKRIDELKVKVARVKDPELPRTTPNTDLPMDLSYHYWMDIRGYKPAEMAKQLNYPMFVLQGGKDFQVSDKDFEGWKKELAQRKDVQFKLYPGLNHLFMKASDKPLEDYYNRPGNVELQVIEDIAKWIKKVRGNYFSGQ